MERVDSFARSVSQQMGLLVDDLSPTSLFGRFNGYHIILQKHRDSYMVVQFSARKKAEGTAESDLRTLLEQEPVIDDAEICNYRMRFQLRFRYGARTQVGNLVRTVDRIARYLGDHDYEDCCEHCGTGQDIKAFMLRGSPSLLCEQCYWELEGGEKPTRFGGEKNIGLLSRLCAYLLPLFQQNEYKNISYKMRSADMEWARHTEKSNAEVSNMP